MKILLLTALVALASADVSHLLNQQQYSGYQYQNPAVQNAPQSSYGAPLASVLGNTAQSLSYSSSGAPQLTLPSGSGSSVDFASGFSTPVPSGIPIQTYNGFPSAAPSVGLSSFQVSSPSPSVDLSSFQVSTPAPSVGLSSFQVSSPSPSVDYSGFQVSTPSSIPSVNLVQYSQPSSSYQFLSKLSQPSVSVPSLGFSSVNGAQFGSDASLNSGINFGQTSFSSSGLGLGGSISGNSFAGQTSGGNLNDAFGVVTDAAGAAGAHQETEVSKHLYFFAAPEEQEEDIQAKIDLPPVPPKKSYKIIFIKAPTYRNQATITIPSPPQNEEKTLVYVLVKKPEGQPKVRFQGAAPAQPSKPEVFFIKYKTQKEAEAAVAEIQSKHGAAGHVIANLPAGTQAAHSESGISVSSGPSPLSFGGSVLGSGSFSGSSFDSAGANSFVSSTPASANFESRFSGQVAQGPHISLVSQQQEPVQVGGGESIHQISIGQGSLTQSPTPVTFGQHSVESLQVFGGGIAPSQSAPTASSASVGVSGGAVTFESNLAGVQQQESNEGGSSASSEEESDVGSNSNTSEAEQSEDGHVSQNVIQERIGESSAPSGDNDSQGSQAAGFASYGPPKY